MEHRIGKRRKLELEVILRQYGRELGRYTTSDISLGGIGLQGVDICLRINSVITLCLLPDQTGEEETRFLRAMVVHQQNGRLGLMWVDDEIVFPAELAGTRHSTYSAVKLPILS